MAMEGQHSVRKKKGTYISAILQPKQSSFQHLILTKANLEPMKVQLVGFPFSQSSSDSFFLFSIIISLSKEGRNGEEESPTKLCVLLSCMYWCLEENRMT